MKKQKHKKVHPMTDEYNKYMAEMLDRLTGQANSLSIYDYSPEVQKACARTTPFPKPAPMLNLADFAVNQQPPPPYMQDFIDGLEGKRKWQTPPYTPTKQSGRIVTFSSSAAIDTNHKPRMIVFHDLTNLVKHHPIPRPTLKELLFEFCQHRPNLSRKNNLIYYNPFYEDEINKFWRLLLKSTPMHPNGNGLKFHATMNVYDDFFKRNEK